jgi:4-amino-4-deoxy-L-arabinose transferase-like glycosyltransferase
MSDFKVYLLIILAGGLFFIPFLGGVHLFDWDEVNFAEISREMIVSHDYLRVQVNYQPFYEKPPLFFWIQVLSMKIFGINEFAARFPNALIGILTMLVLFQTGKKLFSKRFGIVWALAYFGSILPHLYFKSGIIDPLFNLFIFLGLIYFLKLLWKERGEGLDLFPLSKYSYLVLSGLMIGLAMLTKGPVALLIVILVFGVYFVLNKFRLFTRLGNILLFALFAIVVMFIWFGLEYLKNGPEFMVEFIKYQFRLFSTEDAGHGGFPGFHFIVILFGCFPASVFAIRGFYKIRCEKNFQNDFRKWMVILFWVVLILFSIVQSKIIHYSSLAYFPVTFLSALVIDQLLDQKIKLPGWSIKMVYVIAGIFIITAALAPLFGMNINLIKPWFENNVDTRAVLEANVNWTGWESLTGMVLFIAILVFGIYKKRGKIFLSLKSLFVGTAIFVFVGLVFFVGRIEKITQNAHVEFAKNLQGKEGYIVTSGFKSYIHLFYSKRQQPEHNRYNDLKWLIWEEVDTDVYIVAKKHVEEYWQGVHTVEQIGGKNGYVFFKRR